MLRGVAGISPSPAPSAAGVRHQLKGAAGCPPGSGRGSSTTAAALARNDSSKYSKLLRDLEGDSVDTEILDEELRFLKEIEPKTYENTDDIVAQMIYSAAAAAGP